MKKIANPIDAHIGKRIRIRRQALHMDVARLAKLIGVTPKEMELFETGMSRIGAEGLHRAAVALAVAVSYFFGGAEALAPAAVDPALASDALELNRAFVLVRDPAARRRIIYLTISLASGADRSSSDGLN